MSAALVSYPEAVHITLPHVATAAVQSVMSTFEKDGSPSPATMAKLDDSPAWILTVLIPFLGAFTPESAIASENFAESAVSLVTPGAHWQPPGPHAHWGPSEWGCGVPTPQRTTSYPLCVPLHCSPSHSSCGLHQWPQAHHPHAQLPSSSRMAASPAGHVMPSAASSSLQVSGGKGGGGHWQPPGPHAHWGPSEWGCGSPTPHFPVPLHCSPLHSGCGLHHQPQAHHSGVGDGDGSNAPPPPQSVTVHSPTSFTSDVHTGFHSPAPSSYSSARPSARWPFSPFISRR